MAILLNRSGVVEYVKETTFASFPSNPAMNWIGLVQEFKCPLEKETEDVRTLKDATATDKLHIEDAVELGEGPYEIDLRYHPQDWTFWKYVISNTGGGSPTDELASLSLGLIHGGKYCQISGVVIDSLEVNIPYRGKAEVSGKLLAAHIPRTGNNVWSSSDYIGTGSHASKSASPPLRWKDISAVTYGGSNFADQVYGIKFGVNNNLSAEDGVSLYANTSSKVEAIEPQERSFSATVTIRKKAVDNLVQEVLGFTGKSLVFTIGGTTFTFSNAKIAKDVIELAPSGFQTLDVEFVGINNLTIS